MQTKEAVCKYAVPDANDDLTVFYHCWHPSARKAIIDEGFVEAWCICPYNINECPDSET